MTNVVGLLLAVVCSGKTLACRTNWWRNEFFDLAEAPELFGVFLQGCFCAVDSLLSINYLKFCDFVKYIL